MNQQDKDLAVIKKEVATIESKLIIAAKAEASKMFMGIAGLQIGDTVICYFSCSSGTSRNAYHTSVEEEGVIRQDENGVYYVESKRELRFAYSTSNGRTGRQRRDWWEYEQKKGRSELRQILNINQANKEG